MSFAQAAIFGLGLTAVALSQSRRAALRRWAPIFGLAGQPFWLFETAIAGQPGMFALSVAYTVVWAAGAWNQWLRKVPA